MELKSATWILMYLHFFDRAADSGSRLLTLTSGFVKICVCNKSRYCAAVIQKSKTTTCCQACVLICQDLFPCTADGLAYARSAQTEVLIMCDPENNCHSGKVKDVEMCVLVSSSILT